MGDCEINQGSVDRGRVLATRTYRPRFKLHPNRATHGPEIDGQLVSNVSSNQLVVALVSRPRRCMRRSIPCQIFAVTAFSDDCSAA
jgi:hypothetical protein